MKLVELVALYRRSAVELTRHVATEKGVAHYHLPIGSPIGGHGKDPLEATAGLGTGLGLDRLRGDTRTVVEGTPEGDFLEAKKPGLPGETVIAKDFQQKVDLDEGERAALVSYQGSFAELANNAFRVNHPEYINRYGQDVIRRLDKATHEYRTPVPIWLERGLIKFPEENVAGKVVTDPGYMSTSFDHPRFGTVVMHLLAPAGTAGITMMGAKGEDKGEGEFLLPRGTRFLASKDEMLGRTRHIVGTIIPDEGDGS